MKLFILFVLVVFATVIDFSYKTAAGFWIPVVMYLLALVLFHYWFEEKETSGISRDRPKKTGKQGPDDPAVS